LQLASPQTERQQTILNLLLDLNGQERLKRLFWTELNYDKANSPISRKGWGEQATSALADDPVLFATGGKDFHVIHARLKSERLLIGMERPVVSRLLQDHPYALFIFSNTNQDQWHFLNVKYDDDVQKRRLFRRITIGSHEKLRTASERLDKINLADAPDVAPNTIQKLHDDAFDVEPVTREFFEEYRRIFGEVEAAIKGIRDADRKHLFTQRLFNRLMFIAFIQKKGWLKFAGNADYLLALWKAQGQDKTTTDKNFYRDRLKPLFFFGLNGGAQENDVSNINRGGFLKSLIGEVPYLNGGLFDEDEDDKNEKVEIPDAAIRTVLIDLFARFNFTVTESTPLDVEVAVDPEMLGKIFEELVTGRHETGSYYTPKPVVSFMCREAIEGYLSHTVASESKEGIRRFVWNHDPSGLKNGEAVLSVLKGVTACDLACGSGAYLLGLLHELLDLRASLFATKHLDAVSVYDRKLEIIQNSIYGVDVDPFAVNIARLRLWLSLAVDFEGECPPPLPNLDFKIETGDSLLAPDVQGGSQPSFRQAQLGDYLKLKAEFMTAHGSTKASLRDQISALQQDIGLWIHGGEPVAGFDWAVEFAEIFVPGGFDIVLANPPYVRADAQYKHLENENARQAEIARWKGYREQILESDIYETIYEKWDLFVPFLERAHQLLKRDGGMVFIISDSYNGAKYANRSQAFFVEHSTIRRIDFCSEIKLFDAGVYNTILYFTKDQAHETWEPFRVRRFGEKPEDFTANQQPLTTAPQRTLGVLAFRPKAEVVTGLSGDGFVPLSEICYISVGMVIHCDERKAQGLFRAEDLVVDHRDKTHPKPYVEGKDFDRWRVHGFRYLEWGTKRAPKMFRRPTFPELYTVPEKLISMDLAGSAQRIAYDDQQLFHNHSAWSFVPWHYLKGVRNRSIKKTAKYEREVSPARRPPIFREELEERSRDFTAKYLVAVMNSSYANEWLVKTRRNKMHIFPDDWKPLPIPTATKAQQDKIVRLVDKVIVSDNPKHIADLEAEIDERVHQLVAEHKSQPVNVQT
jgi:methylase of polypeptide subunit release factors